MDELKEKTITALTKQVELLGKDGISPGDVQTAVSAMSALTGLLYVLDRAKGDVFIPTDSTTVNQKSDC